MTDDLPTQITSTATRVRARDFVWTVAISGGVAIGTIIFGLTVEPIGPWWAPLVAFASFLAALAIRYRFSSGRDWAGPVEAAVAAEISANRAELARLRLVRGVAQALPEPLFILAEDGVVELANPAACEFLGADGLEGRHFAAVLRAPDVYEVVEEALAGAPARAVDFSTMGSVPRSCRAFVAPLQEEDDPRRVLVYLRDLTSERRVEQMRADFIASASHELRTPLASLLGFIQTLRGHARDDEAAREKFLGVMQAQAERMQRLVADLMSLSRIELNEHVPPSDRVDLAAVAHDVIEAMAPLTAKSGAMISFENALAGSPRGAMIAGERDEVVQAVQNLIDNAVKYGGEPAIVKVRVGRGEAPSLAADDGGPAHRVGDSASQLAARQSIPADDVVYVQVQDFGPGIERGDLPRLTERFYRVNIERSRKRGGTGLGLAIVKHIATRHKGSLHVESRLAGGSAFTLFFPAIRESAASRPGR